VPFGTDGSSLQMLFLIEGLGALSDALLQASSIAR